MKQGIKLLVSACIAIVALASVAGAQWMDKKTLTLAGAKQVVAAAVEEAKKTQSTGAIVVVDDGGHMLYMERLDGTFPAAASVALGKARTAAQFRRPTKVFEDAIKNGRIALTGVMEMVPLEGGVPIVVDGSVVGAVGVSGAMSADVDEQIAQAAAASLGKTAAAGR